MKKHEVGLAYVSQVLADKIRTYSMEKRYYKKDSTIVWINLTVSLIRDSSGEPKYFISVVEDITNRKQTEDDLKEAYGIINKSPAVAFLWKNDEGWPVEFVSENVKTLFGYTAAEFISSKVVYSKIVHPDDLERVTGEVARFSEEEGRTTFTHEPYRIVTKDGKVKWVEDKTYIRRDEKGRITNYQGIVEDITVRKKAEEASLRLGRILDRSINEIYIFDAGTLKFVQVNKGACANLGYTMEELQRFTPLDLKPKFTSESFTKLIEPLRTREKEVIIFNTVHRRKDGSLYPVEVHLQIMEFEASAVFVAITQDITERKQAEEERTKLETTLIQAQKMEAIGTLAGGIAHDFNNILSAIIGYTELAKLDLQEGAKANDNLREALKASRRAKDLVNQILAFSRKTDQERKPIQVKFIVKEALKLLRASLPATIEIRQDIKSDVGIIEADPARIHQVIMNLCTNAGHAMREEGGVLEVNLSNVALNEDFVAQYPDLNPGNYLKLTVSDTGSGMSPSVKERIFDPYFTTKDKSEGTGLGLAIVHGIIKNCGGIIDIETEPEKGSAFHVYLPIIEIEIVAESEVAEPLPTGNESILLIDDEPSLIDIGSQMLESLGYKVETRSSSLEALELFRAEPERFDLVITDMTMPNMTGDKLAGELIKIRRDIPVILCTGYSAGISEESIKEKGICALVMKPLLMRNVANTVRKALDGK